jgi:hypothetical protein
VNGEYVFNWSTAGLSAGTYQLQIDMGDGVVRFSLMTGSGVRVQRISGENFNLANMFRALAKDDLYRAVEVAKSFKYEAPRATVTLAIASSILKQN